MADSKPGAPGAGTEDTDRPAVSPRVKPRADITPLIDTIRTADQPAQAIAAYARANALDRNNIELLNAYLRRMLQLGLPQVAWYPANVLVHLSPDNGMAWAVVGYMHGRDGRLSGAFSATMRAIDRLDDNRSVLFNAGQLAAWYDHQQVPPEVSHIARRILDDRHKQLAENAFFQRGYEAISKAYEKIARRNADLTKKLAAAEVAAREVRKLAVEIDGQMRDVSSEIDERLSRIDRLRRELRDEYTYYRTGPRTTIYVRGVHYGRRYDYYPRFHDRYTRDRIRQDIRDEKQAIEQLRIKRDALLRQGLPVLDEFRQKQVAIDDLRRQMALSAELIVPSFRWDPPAVDGVVTALRDHWPITPVPLPDLPIDPDVEATRKLHLAELYLGFGMTDQARKILLGIVRDYRATDAAAQAAKLLEKFPPTD
jgi:tetratricopeptide (TPR) repeat protein